MISCHFFCRFYNFENFCLFFSVYKIFFVGLPLSIFQKLRQVPVGDWVRILHRTIDIGWGAAINSKLINILKDTRRGGNYLHSVDWRPEATLQPQPSYRGNIKHFRYSFCVTSVTLVVTRSLVGEGCR